MGSNKGFKDEKPIHTSRIKKDFLVSKYEVTFKEYDLFCKDTGKKRPDDKGWGRDFRPVINVSWNDAQKYIKWLNKKSGKNYRLLNEAEWEYVARAGSKSKRCFGSNESQLKNYAWYVNNSGVKTHIVGGKKPNKWGVYNMYGNVGEWTSSWYSKSYNQNRTKGAKVIRGGSWQYTAFYTRPAYRNLKNPASSSKYVGFRLARTLP